MMGNDKTDIQELWGRMRELTAGACMVLTAKAPPRPDPPPLEPGEFQIVDYLDILPRPDKK